jgi:hypothetical protein
MAVDAWKKLITALEKQTHAYKKFLALLEEKEKALIRGNTKSILDISRREEKMLNLLEDAEKQRLEAVAPLDAETPGKSLREMVEEAPEDIREPLEKAAIALMETLNGIALKNHNNAQLVSESLNFIQFNINLLSSAGRRRENIYEGTGRMRSSGETASSAILNKRV